MMSFVRTIKQENPFVQMDKRSIGSGELSLKATGLLLYFLSKPDSWQIRLKDVEKRFKDGMDSIRSGLKELETAGYVYKFRDRDNGGRLLDWVYYVYELPKYNPYLNEKEPDTEAFSPKRDFPKQGKPKQEKPNLDNPAYSNNDLSNKDLSNKEVSSSHSTAPSLEKELTADVFNFYDQNFGGTMTDYHRDYLGTWCDDLSPAIVKKALEETILNGGNTVKYAGRILNDWHRANCKTLADVEKHEQSKKQKKEASHGSGSTGYAGGTGQAKEKGRGQSKYGFDSAGY